MIFRLALTTLSLLALSNCDTQKKAAAATADSATTSYPGNSSAAQTMNTNSNDKNQKVIYLKEGENKFLKEYEMNITFKKITQDSRCPKDANCVWIGNATAEIEVMGLYTRPMTLQLSTQPDAKKGRYTTQQFNGYALSLEQVSPEPATATSFKNMKGNYMIGIRLQKSTDGGTETGTTTR